MMHVSLLVFVSMFVAAFADQYDVGSDPMTENNEIDPDNFVDANSFVDPAFLTTNNKVSPGNSVNENFLNELNDDSADSNNGGDVSVVACEPDSAFSQPLSDSSAKSRRDGVCHFRNSQFRLPGEEDKKQQVASPEQQRQRMSDEGLPEWAAKCQGSVHSYQLCCTGAITRVLKRVIKNSYNVENCIWSTFYLPFTLHFSSALLMIIITNRHVAVVLYYPHYTHQHCADPRHRWCCNRFPASVSLNFPKE